MLKEANFYAKLINEDVQCHLCPHGCLIKADDRGKCQVRRNVKGTLVSENYGLVSSIQSDPIEKKPFYHFCPGAKILSIGSVGCNLKCNFCQNCEISQAKVDDFVGGEFYEPMDVVERAKAEPESIGLAFTYNEPTIYYEFMLEAAQQSKACGMKNLMVSNGFIQQEPLLQLVPYIDAFNIDLKAYCKKFYSEVADGMLEPVLQTLKTIRNSGKHMEVTFLLIPTLNDDARKFKSMVSWIRDELGKQTVLHISRYFPAYKSRIPKTGVGLLFGFCETARAYLDYVYLGNITGSDSQNTICSQCGKIVISRYGYFIQKNGIDHQGRCVHCKNQIVII